MWCCHEWAPFLGFRLHPRPPCQTQPSTLVPFLVAGFLISSCCFLLCVSAPFHLWGHGPCLFSLYPGSADLTCAQSQGSSKSLLSFLVREPMEERPVQLKMAAGSAERLQRAGGSGDHSPHRFFLFVCLFCCLCDLLPVLQKAL